MDKESQQLSQQALGTLELLKRCAGCGHKIAKHSRSKNVDFGCKVQEMRAADRLHPRGEERERCACQKTRRDFR